MRHIVLWSVGGMISLPFLVPFHTYPIPSFYSEWLAFLLGLIAILACIWMRRKDLRLPVNVLWLLGIGVYMQLQPYVIADTIYPESGMIGAMYVFWGAGLVWTGFQIRDRFPPYQIFNTLAVCILLGSIVNAFIGIVQFNGIETSVSDYMSQTVVGARNAFGNVAQTNHYADYLMMGVVSLVWLRRTGNLSRSTSLLVFIIIAYALSLCGTRAIFLYLLVLVYVGIEQEEYSGLSLVMIYIAIALLAFQYLIPYVTSHPPATAIDKFTNVEHKGTGLEIRFYMAEQALRMYLSHPVWGVGVNQYAGHFYSQLLDGFVNQTPGMDRHSHNIFMQIIAEMGTVGLLLWGGWWYSYIKDAIFSWYPVAILSILAVHSMLEYPLWYANFLGIAAIMIGVTSKCYVSFSR